jgi:lactate 2-monooxygenase
MLRQPSNRDLSVSLFGRHYKSPIIMAPIGVQSIYHEDKELGSAEIAASLDIPYIHSTAATCTIEQVAKANEMGTRWFQLYWPQDDDVTKSLLSRAKESGYEVLVVTLDTWAIAWRPADLDNGFVPFIKGVGVQNGFSDPVFREKYKFKTGMEVEEDVEVAAAVWNADVFSGQAHGHTWDDVAFLQKHWDGPIVLKGIQHVDDAIKAAQLGVQGVVVSNHGGRQLDGAIGSLEVLPEIVDAVGDQLEVLFDSGIRTGSDILKALCLGAKAVLVGRPWVYGLAIAGKQGARNVLTGLLAVSARTLSVK